MERFISRGKTAPAHLLGQLLHRITILILTTASVVLSTGRKNIGICAESTRVPNIILILVDDLGYSDVGYSGSSFYETPNIDKLAAQGMVFTDGYAPAPLCSATRAGIMSGQYPARVHITGAFTYGGKPNAGPDAKPIPNPSPRAPKAGPPWQKVLAGGQVPYLPLEVYTLAEMLRDAGYATAHVGKWHLGETPYYPEHQGFDLNFGGYREGWTRSHFYPYHVHNITEGTDGQYMADRLTDEAVAFLKQNKDRPFYLQLWHYAVHTPIQSKDEYTAKYEQKVVPNAPHRNPAYAGMIQSTDESVGRIIAALDELGLAQNTVVVFTSDNGGLLMLPNSDEHVTSNAPLRGGKAMLWEGGIREPFIVRWPAVVKPGSTCDVPVTSVDLYPTFAKLAGAKTKPDQPVDGQSIVPLLKQTSGFNRKAVFWHFPHYIPAFRGYNVTPASAVRAGDYKLIKSFDTGLELYNLEQDLGETKNLAQEMPEVAAELEKLIDDWLLETGASVPGPNPNFDPGAKKPGELADFDPQDAKLLQQWSFDSGADGWDQNPNCRIAASDGILQVTCTADDPFITAPVTAQAKYLVVTLRYRAANSGRGQLFWGTDRAPSHHRSRRLDFRLHQNDGQWHQTAVRIRLAGQLASLRLDVGQTEGRFDVDWIRLYREE